MTNSWERKFDRTPDKNEKIFKIIFFLIDLRLFEATKYVLRTFFKKKSTNAQKILGKYKKIFDYSELELKGELRAIGFNQPNLFVSKGRINKLSIIKVSDLYGNNNSLDLRCWAKLNAFFFYFKMLKPERLSRLWAEKKRFFLRKLFLKNLKFFNKFK
mmetsp:Transcript_26633/g.54261  ORF Transcript_26633/g.54261 Transcript_26633/m.54261 type:complete len:158 (-) Transcript_26633:11-484(-)